MLIEGINVKWHGHATFSFNWEGKVVYTDPFVIPASPEKASLVLVTHSHYDHCDPDKIRAVSGPETKVVCPPDCLEKLPGSECIPISPGKEIMVAGIKVKAVPAYNTNKFKAPGVPFHPKENNWVGYLFTLGQTTFYHAGDTDKIPEMKELAGKVDVAMLPVGGTYTMNLQEAVEAVSIIRPKVFIPMHYNTLPGLELKEQEIRKACENLNSKLVIMEVE